MWVCSLTCTTLSPKSCAEEKSALLSGRLSLKVATPKSSTTDVNVSEEFTKLKALSFKITSTDKTVPLHALDMP